MISLEMAQKLKDAGLEWEPKRGDWCIAETEESDLELWTDEHQMAYETIKDEPESVQKVREKAIWIPRLDQLLAEIEKRGYYPEITRSRRVTKKIYTYNLWDGTPFGVIYGNQDFDSWEDAAASALLWLLERGKE